MSKTINELSLLPNLGLGSVTGTTGTAKTISTGTSVNKPGSTTQKIAQTTQTLTKQINDIATKIAATKEQAAKTTGAEQQQLAKAVNLLQQQLQQLMTPDQEQNEETFKQKAAKGYKALGRASGKAIATGARIPFLSKPFEKGGEFIASRASKFIGLESKNNNNKTINNNTESMKKHKKKKAEEIKEGIIGRTVGGAAKGAVGGGALGAAIGALGGPIGMIGGAATGAAAGAGVGAASPEDEQSLDKLTPIQDEVVDALAKNKYYINRVSYQFAEEEGGPTVFMSKKPNRYSTRYAEVGPDGFVNGESIEDFLKGHEENEEKMLSKKQQRIAKMAGDPNKIDGADFAKLRAMKESTGTTDCKYAKKGCKCNKCDDCKENRTIKESVQVTTFLKAILQKNYAQADKYLGSIVNEKIKQVINKAIQSSQ
jgi:hypothetical protein